LNLTSKEKIFVYYILTNYVPNFEINFKLYNNLLSLKIELEDKLNEKNKYNFFRLFSIKKSKLFFNKKENKITPYISLKKIDKLYKNVFSKNIDYINNYLKTIKCHLTNKYDNNYFSKNKNKNPNYINNYFHIIKSKEQCDFF